MTSYDYEYSKEKFIKYSVALFFLVFASIFVLGSGFRFYTRQNIYRNGIYATGTVTEIEHATNTVIRQYTAKEEKYDVVQEKLKGLRKNAPEAFRDPNTVAPLLRTVEDRTEVFEVH